MGHIYGQALLTICALSSTNASVGLLGYSEAAPGGLPLDIARSTDNYAYVSSPPNLGVVADLLPYETRAWTFQERLLSRRCLFFTSTHVYFQDMSGNVFSVNAFGRPVASIELFYHQSKWDTLPKPSWAWNEDDSGPKYFNITGYSTLMEKYSMRDLTEPQDIIDAFTAVSIRFGKYYSTPIVKGIPTATISYFLCRIGTKVLKRRVSVMSEPLQLSRVFPSWSWFGWQGSVTTLARDLNWNAQYHYFSFVESFLLEEVDLVAELKENELFRRHERTIRTPITFVPTAHPAMLHFMAYCVDASCFRIEDSMLYDNHPQGKNTYRIRGAYQGPPNNYVVSQQSGREPCGGIQISDPEFLPLCSILSGCKLVLLSTMANSTYNKELWSPAKLQVEKRLISSRDGVEEFAQEVRWPWALNALLIKKKNEFWERIGIAIISQEAWDSSSPEEEYVQLV